MYKRILVAVDGSRTSDLALAEAITLARDVGGQLRLVHAVDEVNLNWDAEYPVPIEMWSAVVERAREILEKAAATVAGAGVPVETRLIEFDTPARRVPEAIAQEADDWPADLIVVGTHGRRGLSHVFLGSVAEGVVRVANKPVLLIRGK